MKYEIRPFGHYNNHTVDEIFVTNDQGITISFLNLGARVNRWLVPGKDGKPESIILGYDNVDHLLEGRGYYYGATIGRVAGRIAAGRFQLENQDYNVDQNERENHLHGGSEGLDLQIWEYKISEEDDTIKVRFKYSDSDGHNGYPGNLDIRVTHSFNNDNEWIIEYHATTDQTTLFNPTNHVYFNLNGNNQADIRNHQLKVNASRYIPITPDGLPRDEYHHVRNSVFDLRRGVIFNDLLDSQDEQFKLFQGFDHPFVIDESGTWDAVIRCDKMRRQVKMSTDCSCVVVYTHNSVDPAIQVWDEPLHKYAGVTLETQQIPNAINLKNIQDDILVHPDESYYSCTRYVVSEI